MRIGDLRFASRDEAKKLRKQGFMPMEGLVLMKFVGLPESSVKSNLSIVGKNSRQRQLDWSKADHAFVARKIAEAQR